MVSESATASVSWRPDLHRRHELTDGVYNLPGNEFGLFRAGAGLFEAGVEIRKRLAFRCGRLACGSRLDCPGSPLTLLRGCHVVMVAEVVGAAKTEVNGDGSTFEVVPPRSRKTSETWGTRRRLEISCSSSAMSIQDLEIWDKVK